MIVKTLVIAGLALAAFGGAADVVPTADPTSAASWQVQPSERDGKARFSFEANLDPGARSEDSVAITNLGDEPLSLTLSSVDIVKTPSGDLTLAKADSQALAAGWVTLSAGEVTLDPKHVSEVSFSVAPPAKAEPGDYAVAIVASLARHVTASDGQQALLDTRVGARLYLRVLGDLRSDLRISSLTVDREAPWWNPLPVRASTDFVVSNTGNVRLDASAVVTLEGPFGWKLGQTKARAIPQLLPGDSLRLSQTTDVTSSSTGPAVITSVVAPFLLTATVKITATEVSTGQSFVYSASRSRVDVPWLGIALIVIVTGAVARSAVRRRRGRRSAQRAETAAPIGRTRPGRGNSPGGVYDGL